MYDYRLIAAALLLAAAAASAAEDTALGLNDREYLDSRGLDVLVYSN